MKSLFVRAGVTLLCAATLAACGGSGNGSMLLSGQIQGLTVSGLALHNGSETIYPAIGDATFQFPTLIAENDSFDITVTNPPDAVCTIVNNQNTANIYTVGQAIVTCNTNTYKLGGTIDGLTSAGLTLVNGSNVVSPLPSSPAGTVSFVFPNGVPVTAFYNVLVLSQPPGQTCTVDAPVGTMPSSSYNGLHVTCVSTPAQTS